MGGKIYYKHDHSVARHLLVWLGVISSPLMAPSRGIVLHNSCVIVARQ
jgi:hypothetical protein